MIVINLFGAPSAGKSTGAAYIFFSKMKEVPPKDSMKIINLIFVLKQRLLLPLTN